jgi:hypothetical protein
MNRNATGHDEGVASAFPCLLFAGLLVWAIMGLGKWFLHGASQLVAAQFGLVTRLPYSGF